MQEVESYQQVKVGYFELFQQRQQDQQNKDAKNFSCNFYCNELLLVPAVSLPDVEIP